MAGAAVAKAAMPGTARAANGDPLVVGATVTSTDNTTLDASASNWGLKVTNDVGAGIQDLASAIGGIGVYAAAVGSNGLGLYGVADAGVAVYGQGGRSLDPSPPAGVGVYGTAADDGAAAVRGRHLGAGPGVAGDCDASKGVAGTTATGVAVSAVASDAGTGLQASAPGTGTALSVSGIVRFDLRSGTATIKAGKTSVAIDVSPIAFNAIVLATLQQHRSGIAIEAAVPNPSLGRVTIYVNQAPAQALRVAWFVIG